MLVEQLLAKTKISRQAQFLDSAQGLQEFFAIMIIFGQKQNILTAVFGQLGRQNQEVGTNCVQGSSPIIFGQRQSFEPMNNIGREQKQLKKRHIGFPGIAGDFAQGIIVKEFAVVLFYCCPGIVKQINPPSRHLEIGHENMINISGIFEQSQLFGFLRIFWDRAPDYNKSVRVVPFLMNIVSEFSNLPTVLESVEPASLSLGFDRGIFFGYDDVTTAYSVEESDYSLAVKSRIHAEADTASGDLLRGFCQANLQKSYCSSRRSGVPGTQSSVPEFLMMRLETEKRMIRPSSRFLGVVTNSSSLLPAVDSNHYRIDIEGQAVAFAGQFPQVSPQAVVKPRQLANCLRIQPFQEPAQGCLIREAAQAQHLQKESVVLQDLGFVDSFHSHDDRVQQSQNQFGGMISGLIVRIMSFQTLLDSLLEADLFAKTMNQGHSAEVRQMGSLEEKSDISGSFGHGMQTVHFGRFLSQGLFETYYTPFSSENINLKSQNNRFSRIFED